MVACVALLAAGCTVPGASHFAGPVDGVRPSLALVPADSIGFAQYDTDPSSKRWSALEDAAGTGTAKDALEALWGQAFGDDVRLAAIEPWVGPMAGTALHVLDVDGVQQDDVLLFADVESRSKLETFLRDGGWTRGSGNARSIDGHDVWVASGGSDGALDTLAIADDALIAARSPKALRRLLRLADDSAMDHRTAMAEYSVEAASKVPVALLVRSDVAIQQVRRLFQDDPSSLELSRWLTAGKLPYALRDGWLGVAPPLDRSRRAVRLVGRADWIPDLAPDLDPQPVAASVLDQLPSDVVGAVAVHDLGTYLVDAVNGIAGGGMQFATEDDMPAGAERVELLPLLAKLDGDGAVGWSPAQEAVVAFVRVDDAAAVAAAFTDALEFAKLDGSVSTIGDGVEIALHVAAVRRFPQLDDGAGADCAATEQEQRHDALAAAGTPPRRPIAWSYVAGGACSHTLAGWVTFDGVEHMSWSFDVPVTDRSVDRTLLALEPASSSSTR